jgi:hypothetical protein
MIRTPSPWSKIPARNTRETQVKVEIRQKIVKQLFPTCLTFSRKGKQNLFLCSICMYLLNTHPREDGSVSQRTIRETNRTLALKIYPYTHLITITTSPLACVCYSP